MACGVAVDPPGMTVIATGVVATTVIGVPNVGVKVEVNGVPIVGVTGVPAVAGVVVPLAALVAAIAVWVPRSAMILSGSCPDGNGDTNKPVGSKVGDAFAKQTHKRTSSKPQERPGSGGASAFGILRRSSV